MLRRSARLVVLAAFALAVSSAVPSHAGPVTELIGEGPPPIPLKDMARITKTQWGLRYEAGQQDSHLTITVSGNRVTYVDTGTKKLRYKPKSCSRRPAETGIVVVCRIPPRFRDGKTMFLEVWPRLGDDYVDGSSLPANIRLWALLDAGYDVGIGGAGDDFINLAQDDDRAWGGAGDDWIRGGIGNDEIWGDSGDDKLTAVDGRDQLHGGDGKDWVGGGNGADKLWGDSGDDHLSCGGGPDDAYVDELDRAISCEWTGGS